MITHFFLYLITVFPPISPAQSELTLYLEWLPENTYIAFSHINLESVRDTPAFAGFARKYLYSSSQKKRFPFPAALLGNLKGFIVARAASAQPLEETPPVEGRNSNGTDSVPYYGVSPIRFSFTNAENKEITVKQSLNGPLSAVIRCTAAHDVISASLQRFEITDSGHSIEKMPVYSFESTVGLQFWMIYTDPDILLLSSDFTFLRRMLHCGRGLEASLVDDRRYATFLDAASTFGFYWTARDPRYYWEHLLALAEEHYAPTETIESYRARLEAAPLFDVMCVKMEEESLLHSWVREFSSDEYADAAEENTLAFIQEEFAKRRKQDPDFAGKRLIRDGLTISVEHHMQIAAKDER